MREQKVMPYSEMSEVAVLGAILVYPEVIEKLIERDINPSLFYLPKHQDMYQSMLEVHNLHGIVETQLLISHLQQNEVKFELLGGIDYLMYLVENQCTKSSVDHYLNVIEDKYKLRKIIEESSELIEEAYRVEGDVEDFLFGAEERITNLTRTTKESTMRKSSEVVNDSIETFHKAIEKKGKLTGLRTGFTRLDKLTNGLQKGDLIIIGARPSVGKTAFALNLGLNTAQLNNEGNTNVAIFSLEMPDTHLMNRLISTVSTVPNYKIRNGRVNQEEYNKVSEGANRLKRTNIYIGDSGSTTVPDIFKECRSLKNNGGLDIVIIDYLQLINSTKDSDNRQQEITKISRQLKQLAMAMEVPVIALSQLSRSLEQRDDKRPRLSDLRESGAIEQDADIVMFLHREDYGKIDEEEVVVNNISEVLLRISKHRNGALDDIDLMFEKDTGKFYNKAEEN